MSTEHERFIAMNRRSWNAATPAHNSHKAEQARFLREGGSTLFPEELELAGPVAGRRVAHLQCNCGQDSLSLAALGAEVVGVDQADAAIRYARELSADSGIAAEFVHAELHGFFDDPSRQGDFDLVFSTYGTIGWLPDLSRWARGVAALLRPAGRLVLLEFHPMAWCIDARGRLCEPYFQDGPIHEAGGVSDYVARSGDGLTPMGRRDGVADFQNPHPAVSFQWTVEQIVTAVIGAGLRMETLREYPYANGCALHEGMRPAQGRRRVPAEGVPANPLMLGLTACRDGG